MQHCALFIFEKQQNLNVSSAANYRWRFMSRVMALFPSLRDYRPDKIGAHRILKALGIPLMLLE